MRIRSPKAGAAVAVLLLATLAFSMGVEAGIGSAAEPESGNSGSELSERFAVVQSTLTGSGVGKKLSTRRCPTEAAFSGHGVRPPAQVAVHAPAGSTARLIAYAATNGTLLPAPPKWECTASVGVDGSESIGAGPIGSVTGGALPHLRKGGPSVQATLIPACVGCIASVICSFFPQAGVVKAYESIEPCDDRPRGELRRRISPSAVLFADPPGVKGAAAGSGGALSSLGVITYKRQTGARQLSCTLPASEVESCAAAIVAFIDFGRRH